MVTEPPVLPAGPHPAITRSEGRIGRPRRDGVLLDKNDPVLAVATALDVVMSEHQAALAEAAKPIPDALLRQAVIQGISAHAASIIRATRWRTVLIAAGVVVVLMITTFVGGYFYHGAEPALVGVRAGAEKCDDRADGSRLCRIPVFERLPMATGKYQGGENGQK